MPRGDKYVNLTSFLDNCGKDTIQMTFSEIESILGEELPDSAYLHNAFWSNTDSHSFCFGWMNAGYRSTHPNLVKKTVTFIKSE